MANYGIMQKRESQFSFIAEFFSHIYGTHEEQSKRGIMELSRINVVGFTAQDHSNDKSLLSSLAGGPRI